jgi:hypothetical protein
MTTLFIQGNQEKSNRKGILLIEVLFSALILAILVVSTIYGLEITLKAFKRSNDFTRSIYLAEDLLFQEVKEPGSVEKKGEFDPPNDDFTWKLKRYPDPNDKDLQMAKVIILDKYGRKTYAELATIVKTE